MLAAIRAGLAAGCVAATVLACTTSAFADDTVGTTCNDPTCTSTAVGTGSAPTSAPADPEPGSGSGSGSNGGAASDPTPAPAPTHTLLNNAACTYSPDPTYVPPAGSDTHAGQAGAWYLMDCPDAFKASGGFTFLNEDVWLTTPPPPVAPTPAQLAAQAAAELRLTNPAIDSSPDPGKPELLGVPLWVWAGSSSWSPQSATATAGIISVTATAAPVSVLWSFGDGSSITCEGPGTVYSPSDGASASSPTCGHTYTTAGQFTLTATVTWNVTWAGDGQAGVIPGLTTTSTEPITVEQSNAVVTN
jgi:hypothetical protein